MKPSKSLPAIIAAFFLTIGLAAAAPSPKPQPSPVGLPNRPLRARLIVEVNHAGQVVRVTHGDLTGYQGFDLMVLGNALQMWIRHPDGTAETGTFRVTYDYDPKTKKMTRTPELVTAGGSWANSPGAATMMVNDLIEREKATEARLKAEKAKSDATKTKALPDINAAVRRSLSTPSASPKP